MYQGHEMYCHDPMVRGSKHRSGQTWVMAMCTLGGWVHAWWMSVCLIAMYMLGG